jgi:hypothetical protein
VTVNGAFSARPVATAWVLPGCLASMGGLTLVTLPHRTDVLLLAGLLLVPAAVSAVLVFVSRIRVDAGRLSMTFRGFRPREVQLFGLRQVISRPIRFSSAPALELVALDGKRLEIRLGTWRREDELLRIVSAAAETSHAQTDSRAREILQSCPTAGSWARAGAGKPTTSIGRAMSRLPRPIRWVGSLVVMLGLIIAVYAGFEIATRFSENVLFPRHVDAAWVARFDVPTGAVDTWIGNVAVTGAGVALATREDIVGVWGTVRVRTSRDAGRTWSTPADVSGITNAARHVLVASPDGVLTAAWSERGPAPMTQRLVIRQSAGDGRTWFAPITITAPSGGLVGLPAIVMTDAVRIATRQLYSDADFTDGGLALDASGNRAVVAYVTGRDTVRVATSDDGGRTWRQSPIEQRIYAGRPRLAVSGSTVVLAVTDPNLSARYAKRPFIRVQVSNDGGATWARGPDVDYGARLGSLELEYSTGVWRLLYEACPGFLTCATPSRIWYATSVDGLDWSDSSVVTESGDVEPVGIAADAPGVSVIWATVRTNHDWQVSVSRRNDR